MGLAEAAEEDAEHRVGIGCGANGGAGVAAHSLLVDDDGGANPLEAVDFGAGEGWHEALDEGAVGFIDEPLRLGGDGSKDEGRLAGARDAGEDGEPALGDVERDVLEVVLAGAAHLNPVVTVGGGRGLHGLSLGGLGRMPLNR